MLKHLQIAIRLWIFGLLTLGGVNLMAYEEPKYTPIEKHNQIEIRQYSGYWVAETEVNGTRDESGSAGFKILASYIFGQNQAKQSISMTAPVVQSETILMEKNSAVLQQSKEPNISEDSSRNWIIQFMMPSNYTLETLPKPVDSRIQLKWIPEKKVAAITYSGRWTEANYQEHLKILQDEILKARLKPKSKPPLWARYNSPFTPWFLRKNEILIEVD